MWHLIKSLKTEILLATRLMNGFLVTSYWSCPVIIRQQGHPKVEMDTFALRYKKILSTQNICSYTACSLLLPLVLFSVSLSLSHIHTGILTLVRIQPSRNYVCTNNVIYNVLTHTYVNRLTHTYQQIHSWTHIHVMCMYVYIYVYVSVCTYTHIYIYIYI